MNPSYFISQRVLTKKKMKVHIPANFRGGADKKWNVPTNRRSQTRPASLKEA